LPIGERKECGAGGGGVEWNHCEVGASAMLTWSESESSGIREGHSGEDSTRCAHYYRKDL
jgi:hypothetical protein